MNIGQGHPQSGRSAPVCASLFPTLRDRKLLHPRLRVSRRACKGEETMFKGVESGVFTRMGDSGCGGLSFERHVVVLQKHVLRPSWNAPWRQRGAFCMHAYMIDSQSFLNPHPRLYGSNCPLNNTHRAWAALRLRSL